MKTRRAHKLKHHKAKTRMSRKMHGSRKNKSSKKWLTAIDAASKTLEKTGSITAAQESLRKQALFNARKLFGSIGK
jgi:hypothetical protein